MTAAMRALIAGALVSATSADQACSDAVAAISNNIILYDYCKSTDSTCAATCVPAFQELTTTCEGKNYSIAGAGGESVKFEKATVVLGLALYMDEPCKQAAVDVVLAGGRCNPQDCHDAVNVIGSGSIFFCPGNETAPPTECEATCVAAMDAAYKRCQSDDHLARQLIWGARIFMSAACETVLNSCSYGAGCGSTGTTTEPPSSVTSAESSGDPETCPPSSTTNPAVSLSARTVASSLLAAVSVAMAMLFA